MQKLSLSFMLLFIAIIFAGCGDSHVDLTNVDPGIPVLSFHQKWKGKCSASKAVGGERLLLLHDLHLEFLDKDKDMAQVEHEIFILEDSKRPAYNNTSLLTEVSDYSEDTLGLESDIIIFLKKDIPIAASITAIRVFITLIDLKGNRSNRGNFMCNINEKNVSGGNLP